MTSQHHLLADIDRTSFSIITAELEELGLTPPPETSAVVKRVIHTTADFDYAINLHFTPDAVEAGVAALRRGLSIVTDTKHWPGLQSPALPSWAERFCATWPPRRSLPRPKPPTPSAL